MFIDEANREQMEMAHRVRFHDETRFYDSLSESQLMFLTHLLGGIGTAGGDDAVALAQRFLGTTEAYMAIKFKRCVCGEKHDTDGELNQLLDRDTNKTCGDDCDTAEGDSLG